MKQTKKWVAGLMIGSAIFSFTDKVEAVNYSQPRNYNFSSGANYKEILGHSTQTDEIPRNKETENIRRNASAAFNPPPAGYGNGQIDTNLNNIYATPNHYDYVRDTTNYPDYSSGVSTVNNNPVTLGNGNQQVNKQGTGGTMLPPTSISSDLAPQNTNTTSNTSNGTNPSFSSSNTQPTTLPDLMGTDTNRADDQWDRPANYFNLGENQGGTATVDEPRYFIGGAMARLSIPKLGINNQEIFHGVGYDIIDHHIGHFPMTSSWNGNIALAAHNGGRAGYFQDIHTLNIGDEITLETPQGIRVYVVSKMYKINETDFSLLENSSENRLTLMTCVKGVREQRQVVVAVEKI